MSAGAQAPKGTFDVLPADARARDRLERVVRGALERAGYGRIETPIFEETELFERGVGEATDVVEKEMFSFEDRGGRSVSLRPEGTAPVCRAYVEHGMHKLAQPVKLFYWGPFFRYESPQAGRYRQFHQFGAEAIGSDDPLVDVEVIMLFDEIISELGVPGVTLRVSSLGSPESRAAYREELIAYLQANESRLAADVRRRISANPMRAFDSKDESTREVIAGAPRLLECLEGGDAEHFDAVRGLLDANGVAYEIDDTLVRGLDYYTRTVFEFDSEHLGAQSQLGGGGRYDRLIEQLGGPVTPAAGWAAGIERILLAMGTEGEVPPESRDAFVAATADEQRHRALALVAELRNAGLSAEFDLGGRGLKGQLKQADRVGATATVILEEDGSAQIRDMQSGEQRAIDPAEATQRIEEMRRESG